MDILSLDIQRSRDHGIPSYMQFRKYCGLKDIENIQDFSEIMVEGVSLKTNLKFINNNNRTTELINDYYLSACYF